MGGTGLIVLDTHVIVWLLLEPKNLSRLATVAIKDARSDGEAYYSTISLWEIAYAVSRERIIIPTGFGEFVEMMHLSFGLHPLEITSEIAEKGAAFPKEINSDPADRIIAATSVVHKAQLVTADKNLRKSKLLNTIW